MAPTSKPHLQGWRLVLLVGSLGFGHLIVLFNAGAYIAMLPRVSGSLGVPPSFGTWTQTYYMIGMALAFPLAGTLAARYGEARVWAWAFLSFAGASLLCGQCRDLYPMVAARIVLGLSGGITLPLGQGLMLREYPEERKAEGLALWSLFTLGPFTLGTPAGGWIADQFGWRWLFHLNVPLSLFVAVTVGQLLRERRTLQTPRRFDTVGYLLLAVVLGGSQTLLNQGNDWDWMNSPYLIAVGATVVTALAYLIAWTWRVDEPVLDLTLFAHRNFTIGFLCLVLGFLMFQGLLSLLIVQLQLLLGYSSWLAGLVFLPMAIFAKPAAVVMHGLVQRTDARLLASLNLLLFAATYLWLGTYDHRAHFDRLLGPKLLEGLCLGSLFAPLTALMLHGLPASRHGRAVELAGLMRVAAGAFGITLQGVMLYRRTPFHQSRFVEHLTAFDPILDQTRQLWVNAGFSDAAAVVQTARVTTRQAALLAINDAFWASGCIFVGLSLLVWLAKPTHVRIRTRAEDIRREALEELIEEP